MALTKYLFHGVSPARSRTIFIFLACWRTVVRKVLRYSLAVVDAEGKGRNL